MFRKASYITMVVSVILSWGVMLNVAEKADLANGTDITPALGASAQSYLVKLAPSQTALADTSHDKLQKEKIVKVYLATPKTVISKSARAAAAAKAATN